MARKQQADADQQPTETASLMGVFTTPQGEVVTFRAQFVERDDESVGPPLRCIVNVEHRSGAVLYDLTYDCYDPFSDVVRYRVLAEEKAE
jgi:hypothetical protein